MRRIVLTLMMLVALCAPGAYAATNQFMMTSVGFIPAILPWDLSEASLAAQGVDISRRSDKFSDQPPALAGGQVFGVQTIGSAMVCPKDDPCLVVFLADAHPGSAIYASRKGLADIIARHGDAAAQEWLAQEIAWQDNGGKPSKKPPLYRAANLLAGAFVSGATQCGVFPSSASTLYAFLSSSADGLDLNTSPEGHCVTDPAAIPADGIGFTSGVKGPERLKLLCDGTLALSFISMPQNKYLEDDPECFPKVVLVLDIGEGPAMPTTGIVVRKSTWQDPSVRAWVHTLACAHIVTVDDMRKPENHDKYVNAVQGKLPHGAKPATPDEAARHFADLLKYLNPTGTLPDSDMERVRAWYLARSGLMGDATKKPQPLEWDFSQVPTLQECAASN